MKIILKKDIEGLGFKYDILSVKPGYARNFLFPKGYAIHAIPSEIKQINEILKQRARKEKAIIEKTNLLADKIKNTDLKLFVNVRDDGKLFGVINNNNIHKELLNNKIDINRKCIKINKTIKYIGKYNAIIRLHREVEINIKFEVLKEIKKEIKSKNINSKNTR